MSGTGKSTLICELAARGYKAVDAAADDDDWSEWLPVVDRDGLSGELDRVWREDRIQNVLSTKDADVLFLSGCATNQGELLCAIRPYCSYERARRIDGQTVSTHDDQFLRQATRRGRSDTSPQANRRAS
jgi:hypothetical protein